MHRKRQSAQVSLALLIASAITLGMLVLTIVLIGQSFRGMEKAKVSAAGAAARQLAVSVDDRIQAITAPPSTALAVLSHDSLAGVQTLAQRLDRLPVLADILTSSDIVSAVYAGYQNGDFILLRKVRSSGTLQFPDAPDETRFLLQTITHEGHETPGQWHFFDAEMQLIEQRPVPEYNYDPRTRPWFNAAKKSDSTELSAPYAFFTTQETGITLSRRASGETGGPGTIFGIDVTVTDPSTQLAELRQTPNTRVAIVNQNREVLADSGNRKVPGPAISGALDRTGDHIDGSSVTRFSAEGED